MLWSNSPSSRRAAISCTGIEPRQIQPWNHSAWQIQFWLAVDKVTVVIKRVLFYWTMIFGPRCCQRQWAVWQRLDFSYNNELMITSSARVSACVHFHSYIDNVITDWLSRHAIAYSCSFGLAQLLLLIVTHKTSLTPDAEERFRRWFRRCCRWEYDWVRQRAHRSTHRGRYRPVKQSSV